MAKNICAVCDEQIYKPVCPLCLTDQMQLWFEKNKISLVRDFRQEVRLFLDRVRRYNRLTCTLCRIETETAICQACFKDRIFNWVGRTDKALATDFIRAFSSQKLEEPDLEYA